MLFEGDDCVDGKFFSSAGGRAGMGTWLGEESGKCTVMATSVGDAGGEVVE